MSFIKKPVSASVNSIYSQGIHSWFRLEACNHKFSSQIQTTKQRLRQKVRIKELTKTDPSKNGKKKYNIPDQHKQPLINHKSNRYTQNPSITTTTTAYKKKTAPYLIELRKRYMELWNFPRHVRYKNMQENRYKLKSDQKKMELNPSHLLVLGWASQCKRTKDSSGETGIIRSSTSTSAVWFMKLTGKPKAVADETSMMRVFDSGLVTD